MSLTLAEARARAALLSDVSYDLHLDLTDRETFGCPRRGPVRAAREPGATTFLELADAREVLRRRAARDDVRRAPDRARRTWPPTNDGDGGGPGPLRHRRRRDAHLHRPGRRRDLRVGVRRHGHLPAGLPLLRPERPQGAGVADGHRARGLDGAGQRPGRSEQDGRRRGSSRRLPRSRCRCSWSAPARGTPGPGSTPARRPDAAVRLARPRLAGRPARPRLRRAARGHRAVLRPLRRDRSPSRTPSTPTTRRSCRGRTGVRSRPPAASPTATRSCRSAPPPPASAAAGRR